MQAGDARLTDTRQDEQDRCITIKSTGADLVFFPHKSKLHMASPGQITGSVLEGHSVLVHTRLGV